VPERDDLSDEGKSKSIFTDKLRQNLWDNVQTYGMSSRENMEKENSKTLKKNLKKKSARKNGLTHPLLASSDLININHAATPMACFRLSTNLCPRSA